MFSKLYSKYFFFYFASLLTFIMLFKFPIFSEAKDSFSKNLPKTKETSASASSDKTKKDLKLKDDKKAGKDSKDKSKDVQTTEEEDALADDIEEKSDPSKSFKLIAIYLIGNRPRVLLKDLSDPDEPPKEFQEGDYLNDEQTVSISKINFNPTARIELTDLDGISYLLKPQNLEDSMSGVTTSTSKPTYFSSGSKSKIKRSVSTPPSPVNPPPNPPPQPAANNAPAETAKKEEAPASPAPAQAGAPAQALMAVSDSAGSAGATALTAGSGASATGSGPGGGSEPPKDPPMDSMGADSRPVNPFE